LPGEVLHEETFQNPTRVATGQIVFIHNGAPEFVYDTALTQPFQAEAHRRYWLEMVQIGDINSTYRREYALADGTPYATISPNSNHMWIYSETQANLSIQIIGVPEPDSLVLFLLVTSLFVIQFKHHSIFNHSLGDRHTQQKEARVCHPPDPPAAHSCSPLLP
jgi:hypothetical protein